MLAKQDGSVSVNWPWPEEKVALVHLHSVQGLVHVLVCVLVRARICVLLAK